MWTKDYYQETFLSYLGFVQTEIEALERSRAKRGDIAELYENTDATLERLWRIVRANDTEWEVYRRPAEESCEHLQSALFRVQGNVLKLQIPQRVEVYESAWQPLDAHRR